MAACAASDRRASANTGMRRWPRGVVKSMTAGCAFCEGEGGQALWRGDRCRVVPADEPFPGFCRVIWKAHVREMTDLTAPDRDHVMQVVWVVEKVLRARLVPDKMNLASLGNVTPYLHWHVIPRFADDSHFPSPVWHAPLRNTLPPPLPIGYADALGRDFADAFSDR